MKKNKRSKAVLATIMALSVLASVLVLPAYAANENVTVGITSLSVWPGDTATVPIIVYNVTDLGAGTIRVTYNPLVCTVTDVTAGNLPGLTKDISIPGIANISIFDFSTGHTGNVTFANLSITATGNPGETSPLNITVISLYTWFPTVPILPANIRNGTFTILGEPTPIPVPGLGIPAMLLLIVILTAVIVVSVRMQRKKKR